MQIVFFIHALEFNQFKEGAWVRYYDRVPKYRLSSDYYVRIQTSMDKISINAHPWDSLVLYVSQNIQK